MTEFYTDLDCAGGKKIRDLLSDPDSQGPAELCHAAGYINLRCVRTPVSAHAGWALLTCISSLPHTCKGERERGAGEGEGGGQLCGKTSRKPRQVCTSAGVAKPLASNICVLMQMDSIQIGADGMWLLFEAPVT